MQQSIFIVLDGIDGSGTSTHSKLLAGFLSLKGLKIYLTQEPSNSEVGKLLRAEGFDIKTKTIRDKSYKMIIGLSNKDDKKEVEGELF